MVSVAICAVDGETDVYNIRVTEERRTSPNEMKRNNENKRGKNDVLETVDEQIMLNK